ncbi:MAG: glycogen/starch/alpha-glucan phosphorylase [Lachnospiraceae bacterium]|nr:glycogen/starch/alpha-glucan phosphorylase [Lachnospiraceae bacterium]
MANHTNMSHDILVLNYEEQLTMIARERFDKSLKQLTNHEWYIALLHMVGRLTAVQDVCEGRKKLYYISMEFLIGKLLVNNLINLRIYDKTCALLESYGTTLAAVAEEEPEPSLGNGGLGRLAACFVDSLTTLSLPGEGIGLLYHYGLFKQKFRRNMQTAQKNDWIEDDSFLEKTDMKFDVYFGKKKVTSRLYNLNIIGYNAGINKLRLFDLESVDERLVTKGIGFDKKKIAKNLTLFLYPDDSDVDGNLLRIYQEYFLTSNAAQFILKQIRDRGQSLHRLHEYVVIQINDTHPTLVIPELIRLLVEEHAFTMDDAIKEVKKCCAYTNHTILAEALETWPEKYLKKVVPQLMPYIKELDARIRAKVKNPKVQIIDEKKNVHMAFLDIHYGFSVNGVAAIHTEILKNSELKDFYDLYPEKFNNKTNGITFRRWLIASNQPLARYLDDVIGTAYRSDATQLNRLMRFYDDKKVLKQLEEIKHQNKVALAAYIKKHEKVEIDPESVFDIQAKRLHEYKRQQMNALYIIHKYYEIKKENKLPKRPITFIFGAKAAPAYVIAQDIIHLILVLQKVINNDPKVSKYMKVVMVENYNVSYAEKLMPACDISEQISLASKEASGTGNMKFMLNGAVTLGTDDGANVEIHDLVGDENIYIFGVDADTVIKHYENADYKSIDYYKKSKVIKRAVNFLTSATARKAGNRKSLDRLYNELLNKDWFMTLIDLEDYIKVKDKMLNDYEKRTKWRKMMLVNIAKAGFFSSDRTIADYNRDIWKLK